MDDEASISSWPRATAFFHATGDNREDMRKSPSTSATKVRRFTFASSMITASAGDINPDDFATDTEPAVPRVKLRPIRRSSPDDAGGAAGDHGPRSG
jgi:hypothetical protein